MFNIGYLGPQGTYSSYASDLYSQNDIKIPFNTINEVLNSLKTSKSDKVIVPLENSINGSIVEVLDFLASKNFKYTNRLDRGGTWIVISWIF